MELQGATDDNDSHDARDSASLQDHPTVVKSLEQTNATLSMQIDRLQAALDNMSQGLCMFDARSKLIICNRRYCEIFGISPDTMTSGMSQEDIAAILVAAGSYPESVTLHGIRDETQSALRQTRELPVLRELADGRILSILYRAMPGGGWVSTFEDVTERRRSEETIDQLARHDTLTGLVNRRTFSDEAHDVLTGSDSETSVLALLCLNLDRFKVVNEAHGHRLGDELLGAVARRLQLAAQRGDVVGRIGADEFAIMRRVSRETDAMRFAERLAGELAVPYALSTATVEVSASIGVSTREGRIEDVENLLNEADLALRQAKAADRGSVCLYDPSLSEAARARRKFEAELHAALVAGQFEVHYQPLVELDGGRLTGVEALARWNHPERGYIPPATFIPVAEEIGLIVQLGDWVLRRACRDAGTWPDDVTVAVNVSSHQLRQSGFASTVLQALSEAKLSPLRLEIEITETALLDDTDVTLQNLNELHRVGIRFAMDDFGTGYSSLSYLRRFPIDKIKIDRSFTKDADTSADALAIIRAVAGLGVSLGMTTLVEGIETEQQLALARAEGVSQGQGYLFGRPQPASDILKIIAERR